MIYFPLRSLRLCDLALFYIIRHVSSLMIEQEFATVI